MGNSLCQPQTQPQHLIAYVHLPKKQKDKTEQEKTSQKRSSSSMNTKSDKKTKRNAINFTQNQLIEAKQDVLYQHEDGNSANHNMNKEIETAKEFSKTKQAYKSNFQPISVPFSVISLLLRKNLSNLIEINHPKFFTKYENDLNSFKLYKSGCYGHVLSQGYGIFVNAGYFYEGSFSQTESGEIFPEIKGNYLTETSKYVGEFKEGKPHGQGKYYDYSKSNLSERQIESQCLSPRRRPQEIHTPLSSRSAFSPGNVNKALLKETKQATYEGEWQDGKLVKGTIQNYFFKYVGCIKNSKPHGYGKLQLKHSDTTYKGEFKNGLFDGKMSIYETPYYTYEGSFKNGKKQGYGILTIKQPKVQQNNGKSKYLTEEKIQGRWRQDQFIQEEFHQQEKA